MPMHLLPLSAFPAEDQRHPELVGGRWPARYGRCAALMPNQVSEIPAHAGGDYFAVVRAV